MASSGDDTAREFRGLQQSYLDLRGSLANQLDAWKKKRQAKRQARRDKNRVRYSNSIERSALFEAGDANSDDDDDFNALEHRINQLCAGFEPCQPHPPHTPRGQPP